MMMKQLLKLWSADDWQYADSQPRLNTVKGLMLKG